MQEGEASYQRKITNLNLKDKEVIMSFKFFVKNRDPSYKHKMRCHKEAIDETKRYKKSTLSCSFSIPGHNADENFAHNNYYHTDNATQDQTNKKLAHKG